MSELKPCPRCGRGLPAISLHQRFGAPWRVECWECGMTTGYHWEEESAIEEWNSILSSTTTSTSTNDFTVQTDEPTTICAVGETYDLDKGKPNYFFYCASCEAKIHDMTMYPGDLNYCPSCGYKIMD